MTSRTPTKMEKQMAEILNQLDPESLRFKVLDSAKKFKSNWLDLGAQLHHLAQSEDFKKWGYVNFEDYCKKELKIKADTAMKLVASYGYVKKFKPDLSDSSRPFESLPDFKVMNKLVEAEKKSNIPENDFQNLCAEVFNEGLSFGALQKKIRTLEGDAPPNEPKEKDEEQLVREMKKAITTIKKICPIFDPDDRVMDALTILETYLEQIEI